jgi:hypothetical protein
MLRSPFESARGAAEADFHVTEMVRGDVMQWRYHLPANRTANMELMSH